MKARLQTIVCLFLALSVGMASVGYTLEEHLCKFKGRQVGGMVKKSCCAFSQKKHRKGCCQTDKKLVKVETKTTLKSKSSVSLLTFVFPNSPLSFALFFQQTPSPLLVGSADEMALPPPLSGRKHLLKKRCLLI
jgi:hypothetical protein